MYYVPAENPDPYPPAIDIYLNNLAPTIGAEVEWTETSDEVYNNFAKTGRAFIFPTIFSLMYLRNSTR